MDGERFDRMSRAMGAANSRRGLLRAFAGGLAAAVLGTVASGQDTNAQQTCDSDAECGAYQRCLSGYCVASSLAVQPPPNPAPPIPPPGTPNPNKSTCCSICSRRYEGCAIACFTAPDRNNCMSGCVSRNNSCVALCPCGC